MIQDIRTYLLQDAAIATAVGGYRLHVGSAPQGSATPYGAIYGVSAYRHRTLNADVTPNLANYRVQIDLFGDTAQSVGTLKDLIITKMDAASRTTVGSTTIIVAILDGLRHDFSKGSEAGSQRHRLSVEFMVTVKEN